jgi:hypothetical protein
MSAHRYATDAKWRPQRREDNATHGERCGDGASEHESRRRCRGLRQSVGKQDRHAAIVPPGERGRENKIGQDNNKTRQAHAAPEVGERVLCRHPFDSSKRAYVTPSRVLELHAPVFEGGRRVAASEDLRELRAYCQRQLGEVREDVLRPLNPTPYKTSVSAELFSFLQDALQRHQPITELT